MRFSDSGEHVVLFTLMTCIIGDYLKPSLLHLNMNSFYPDNIECYKKTCD